MYDGSRITDAVEYWRRRGELRGAVTIVRTREPERFRWRRAVSTVSASVGSLRGKDRLRVEGAGPRGRVGPRRQRAFDARS